jgi:hypothetical protein
MDWINQIILILGTIGPAIWLYFDSQRRWRSRRRLQESLLWVFGTIVAGPIVLPVYLAQRPLLRGETRRGGRIWQFCKNFILFWTLYFLAIATLLIINAIVSDSSPQQYPGPKALDVLGAILVIGSVLYWLFPVLIALLIGLLNRDSSNVEMGE